MSQDRIVFNAEMTRMRKTAYISGSQPMALQNRKMEDQDGTIDKWEVADRSPSCQEQ